MHDPAGELAPELTEPALTAPVPPAVAVRPEIGPDRGAASRRPGWLTPFRVLLVVLAVVATVVGLELTGGSGAAYRTALVGTGTAVATLDGSATLTPVHQANLAFDVSGTIGTVDVAVGQQVTAGQVVASLDTSQLQADVVSSQGSLADAQLALARDQASETSTSSATSGSGTPGAGSAGSSGASATTTTQPTSAGHGTSGQPVQALQSTLLSDQRQEDADSAAASAAIRAAATACAASSAPVSSAVQPATTSSSSASSSGRPSPPTAPPATGTGTGPASSCSSALAEAAAAQSRLASDIRQVEKDEAALNSALESAGSGSGATGAGSDGGTHGSPSSGATAATTAAESGSSASGSGSNGSGGSGSNGSGGSNGKPATATKLAVDQASIDAAQANLDHAQAALGGANLVSTISGTVASVSITPGGSVTAGSGSSSPAIVVVGPGNSYQAVTEVPVTRIGSVAVGERAVVAPDASSTSVSGTVTAIGVLATTSSSTVTYPVTVSLTSADLGGFSGSEARVSIVTGSSTGTTVPSSAIRTVGSIHLVTLLAADGTTQSKRVTLGTVGAILTRVTSGLTQGQRVVLADNNQPVPSSSTATGRFGFAGLAGGGTGRGGFGGSGFGGTTKSAVPTGG